MELHELPNLKLPPLRYEKKQERQLIESDPKVRNLIGSNRLLDSEINGLLQKISQLTEEINKNLKTHATNPHDYKKAMEGVMGKGDRRYFFRFLIDLGNRDPFGLIRNPRDGSIVKDKEKLKQIMAKEFARHNSLVIRGLEATSNKIVNDLDRLEKREDIQLDILVSRPIYFCPNCKSIICMDRFHTTTCNCGEKITTTEAAKTITLHLFNQRLMNFIDLNMWVEHGVDFLFRKKEFSALCGVYVLGHSGVAHEIDNIAESIRDNIRVFCECKNSPITVSDVFVFSGKMADVGCSRGYIFTTATETQKEIRQLARSKNISIVDSIFKMTEAKLLDEIKE